MINKSTRSTSTNWIHSLLNRTLKIGDFWILTTKFNYHICLRNKFFNCFGFSNNFLNKINAQIFFNKHSTRACYIYSKIIIFKPVISLHQNICNCLFYIWFMSSINWIKSVKFIISNNNLYSRRTDIKSHM